MNSLDYVRFRVDPGRTVRLSSFDPADTLGVKKSDAEEILRESRDRLAVLQERLYAEGERSLLLIVQAMDGGGKDSTIKRVLQGVDPGGVLVANFKAPNKEELAHDFLWRVHQRVPAKGYIGVFNRSHYEDVLIVRVHGWAPPELIEARYEHINAFERILADHGTTIVKVFLHISNEYQLTRMRRRLEQPDKWWKFDPADISERPHWNEYMEAYELVLNRCSTSYAPWYVVPAEHKWFRSLVVSQILVDTLEGMNPQFPRPRFDPAAYPPETLQ